MYGEILYCYQSDNVEKSISKGWSGEEIEKNEIKYSQNTRFDLATSTLPVRHSTDYAMEDSHAWRSNSVLYLNDCIS